MARSPRRLLGTCVVLASVAGAVAQDAPSPFRTVDLRIDRDDRQRIETLRLPYGQTVRYRYDEFGALAGKTLAGFEPVEINGDYRFVVDPQTRVLEVRREGSPGALAASDADALYAAVINDLAARAMAIPPFDELLSERAELSPVWIAYLSWRAYWAELMEPRLVMSSIGEDYFPALTQRVLDGIEPGGSSWEPGELRDYVKAERSILKRVDSETLNSMLRRISEAGGVLVVPDGGSVWTPAELTASEDEAFFFIARTFARDVGQRVVERWQREQFEVILAQAWGSPAEWPSKCRDFDDERRFRRCAEALRSDAEASQRLTDSFWLAITGDAFSKGLAAEEPDAEPSPRASSRSEWAGALESLIETAGACNPQLGAQLAEAERDGLIVVDERLPPPNPKSPSVMAYVSVNIRYDDPDAIPNPPIALSPVVLRWDRYPLSVNLLPAARSGAASGTGAARAAEADHGYADPSFDPAAVLAPRPPALTSPGNGDDDRDAASRVVATVILAHEEGHRRSWARLGTTEQIVAHLIDVAQYRFASMAVEGRNDVDPELQRVLREHGRFLANLEERAANFFWLDQLASCL